MRLMGNEATFQVGFPSAGASVSLVPINKISMSRKYKFHEKEGAYFIRFAISDTSRMLAPAGELDFSLHFVSLEMTGWAN